MLYRRFWPLALLITVACSEDESPPAADLSAAVDQDVPADAGVDAPVADLDVASDAAASDGISTDVLPDLGNWPAGFTPQPKNVPTGLLCNIPFDYIDKGGDPVNPPCEVEADSFSTADHTVMPSALKVVTWNIEFGKKSAEVKKALSSDSSLLDADVLLLQEVPRIDKSSTPAKVDLARELAQMLKKNYVFAVEWDRRLEAAGGGEHGLAVLSRFPIGNVALIRHVAVYDHYSEKKLFGGRATLAVEIVAGGKRLLLYNSHLDTRDLTGLGRAKQGAEILADAKKSGRPTTQVLGGDLNTFICNPQLLTCNKPPAAEPVIQDILKDGWTDLLPSFNGWTQLGVGFFPQRLDWLFARQVTPISGKVLQGIKAADHVPVVAVFSVP
jgi:endonuclease/exonuclease/phosphatase family metal-dependent hydrolase